MALRDGESWTDALARALGESPSYGIMLGERQLGLRAAACASDNINLLWEIQGVPLWWGNNAILEQVAAASAAEDAAIVQKQRRGSKATWYVRCRAAESQGVFAIVTASDDGEEVTCWARRTAPWRRAPRRAPQGEGLQLLPRAGDRPASKDDMDVEAEPKQPTRSSRRRAEPSTSASARCRRASPGTRYPETALACSTRWRDRWRISLAPRWPPCESCERT